MDSVTSPGVPARSGHAGGDAALALILRDPDLIRAGAWLGGAFRRNPSSVVRPPIEGDGFRERLRDTPVPGWPWRDDPERDRNALETFAAAGLLVGDASSGYRAARGAAARLEAFLLYHHRSVENFRARMPWLRDSVRGLAVLDAGCGVGAYAMEFRDAGARSVLAVDLDVHRLAIARDYACATGGGIHTVRASVERLPVASGSVDLYFSRVVFPYVHLGPATAEVARVLAPRGRAVLVLHAAGFYAWQLRETFRGMGPAADAAYAVLGLIGGVLVSWFGCEPVWRFGSTPFRLTYQTRRAFRRLVESHGLCVDGWLPDARKPIVCLSRASGVRP